MTTVINKKIVPKSGRVIRLTSWIICPQRGLCYDVILGPAASPIGNRECVAGLISPRPEAPLMPDT